MAKVKITIDRNTCIGCGVCANLCPDVFELNPNDGKSSIVEKFRVGGDLGAGEVDESLEECANSAAGSCPVSAIKVEKA
ncbi:ferredoxin [Fervidicoccus fontis]|jgi:ferredoxin|uniref:Ferredoxin n=1 Tax=Fervidicoccus fontis TaxID=683846 RepID=A0A843A9H9_9CREN|nr:ferredoxin [Fervidicoccus fontis]MBE9391345.1 ferredoxin [Fervidicoccus fontis]